MKVILRLTDFLRGGKSGSNTVISRGVVRGRFGSARIHPFGLFRDARIAQYGRGGRRERGYIGGVRDVGDDEDGGDDDGLVSGESGNLGHGRFHSAVITANLRRVWALALGSAAATLTIPDQAFGTRLADSAIPFTLEESAWLPGIVDMGMIGSRPLQSLPAHTSHAVVESAVDTAMLRVIRHRRKRGHKNLLRNAGPGGATFIGRGRGDFGKGRD